MISDEFDLTSAATSLLLAMGLSFGLSALYTSTYRGVAYLKGFAQSLALGGLVSAAVMLCVGDSIARGIGVFGAVNLVQVRNNVKDTRDLMFVFITFATGVAAGVGAWGIALLSSGLFTVGVLLQSVTAFGTRRGVSAVLRVRVTERALQALPQLLAQHTTQATLASSRSVDHGMAEQTWQVRLANTDRQASFLAALPEAGITDSSMLVQDDSLEV